MKTVKYFFYRILNFFNILWKFYSEAISWRFHNFYAIKFTKSFIDYILWFMALSLKCISSIICIGIYETYIWAFLKKKKNILMFLRIHSRVCFQVVDAYSDASGISLCLLVKADLSKFVQIFILTLFFFFL